MRLKKALLDRLFGSYEIQRRIAGMFHRYNTAPSPGNNAAIPLAPLPKAFAFSPCEPDDGPNRPPHRPCLFITARFRTGSTLLWSLFDSLDGLTAYYEPLNERRWFDPASDTASRDQSHAHDRAIGRAYTGLDDIGRWFTQDWTYRRLYMDAASGDENLHAFIAALVARAPRFPVLQFNRVDFRLAWLRARFPAARILHLYRHPRDQWLSALQQDAPRAMTLADFAAYDGFYLRAWARDLRNAYPFLDLPDDWHPYALFYLIWRLSYSHGRHYAAMSVAYEDLVADVPGTLGSIARRFDLPVDNAALEALGKAVRPSPRGGWQSYADDGFFREIEERCDAILTAAFDDIPATP